MKIYKNDPNLLRISWGTIAEELDDPLTVRNILDIADHSLTPITITYPPTGEHMTLSGDWDRDENQERLTAFVKLCKDGRKIDELVAKLGLFQDARDDLKEKINLYMFDNDNAGKVVEVFREWLEEQKP